MKKLALAAAAATALMFTAPVLAPLASTPAEAQTVVKKKVVIKHGDRGRHMGWRHHGGKKVVIIKRGGGHHMHGHGRTVVRKTTVVR